MEFPAILVQRCLIVGIFNIYRCCCLCSLKSYLCRDRVTLTYSDFPSYCRLSVWVNQAIFFAFPYWPWFRIKASMIRLGRELLLNLQKLWKWHNNFSSWVRYPEIAIWENNDTCYIFTLNKSGFNTKNPPKMKPIICTEIESVILKLPKTKTQDQMVSQVNSIKHLKKS